MTWFLLTLLGPVFFDPLPQPHCFLLRPSLFPASRIPQSGFDQIIGELGHGDSTLLGFVVKGADDETGQGRGVVLLWHGPFRFSVRNERTKFNSLYLQRNRLMKGGGACARKHHASWFTASASSKGTALTESILSGENIRPGASEPVHDLLKRLERDALLSIFETEQARRRDSEFPCVSSKRRFSPSFAEKSRKLLVQRLPHGKTLNDLAFLMRNVFACPVPYAE